jgi:hypothetical protein
MAMSPDRRKHRGPHPDDYSLFSDATIDTLRKAVADYSLLLGRGYAARSSLKLVGDRYALTARQRTAIRRASASDGDVATRRAKEIGVSEVTGRLVIDGFNVIVTIEAALAGGILLLCRDGTIRDLASMHGSYRKVDETEKAVRLILGVLKDGLQSDVLWLLDRPVSNAGRLSTLLNQIGAESGQNWNVVLADDVDARLIAAKDAVASSDSRVIDGTAEWVNLAAPTIRKIGGDLELVDLNVSAVDPSS